MALLTEILRDWTEGRERSPGRREGREVNFKHPMAFAQKCPFIQKGKIPLLFLCSVWERGRWKAVVLPKLNLC